MDNFHFINLKTVVDRSDSVSIKDAIFKRAKEKANALAEEKNQNYINQVQDDLMDSVRETVQKSSMNPFNQFINNINKPVSTEKDVKVSQEKSVKQINNNVRNIENKTENSVKEDLMESARNQFRSGTNINAILNYLNTKAAIKMAEDAHSKINYATFR